MKPFAHKAWDRSLTVCHLIRADRFMMDTLINNMLALLMAMVSSIRAQLRQAPARYIAIHKRVTRPARIMRAAAIQAATRRLMAQGIRVADTPLPAQRYGLPLVVRLSPTQPCHHASLPHKFSMFSLNQ
ncbi:MAG: hypothetical protein CBB65_05520 [Hyphomonadaceae bacterium TMED5]|nr:hypothetical protein [Ponticaulis sp.]OUX99552.1 MAG: hypothetical protein CBB65_05520 [Hyphomonadaceae bacterium TMED5]